MAKPKSSNDRFGFVIMSHDNPSQLLRLTKRLLSSFNGCPIVCHHDLQRCTISTQQFPSQVTFVQPSLRTFWGHISLVHAELKALQSLYDRADPDWFAILSGCDYPAASGADILKDLFFSEYDAYLDNRRISGTNIPRGQLHLQNNAQWTELAINRYLKTMLAPAVITAISSADSIEQADDVIEQAKEELFVPSSRPFPPAMDCYAGDHWLTGNRKVADYLLRDSVDRAAVLEYFSRSLIPDEAVYHTLLGNNSELKISSASKRYLKWSPDGLHPRYLCAGDLPGILKSGAYFARKFKPDDMVLDRLDTAIDA